MRRRMRSATTRAMGPKTVKAATAGSVLVALAGLAGPATGPAAAAPLPAQAPAPAPVDPPGAIHYVKGSGVSSHGCKAHLDAHHKGGFHVRGALVNASSADKDVACSAEVFRKHGKGRWLYPSSGHYKLSAPYIHDRDTSSFYYDGSHWWIKVCVQAWSNNSLKHIGPRRCSHAY